jgi:ABC-type sugar transport system ATPase subunit
LVGLFGSGRTETARAVFGVDPPAAGTIRLVGEEIAPREPSNATTLGVGFSSEDRKADGVIPDMSVRENLKLAILPVSSGWAWIHCSFDELWENSLKMIYNLRGNVLKRELFALVVCDLRTRRCSSGVI